MPLRETDGGTKIPAAWLVERAGFPPGARRGPVGVSRHHAPALAHHGGGTARELKRLACAVRAAVRERFGVTPEVEPEVPGPGRPDPETSPGHSDLRCPAPADAFRRRPAPGDPAGR